MAALSRLARSLRWLFVGGLGLLLTILVGGAFWLDTDSGHRFLVRQIEAQTPSSGLRIAIGRLDGSIYKRVQLRDVTLSDPDGWFLSISEAQMDWFPFAWFANRLDIDRVHIPNATLLRRPKLRPGRKDAPILPDFDVRLLDLRVGRLNLAPAVVGKAHVVALAGRADIRGGRAILNARLLSRTSADRIAIDLDSRPDEGRFDLDARVVGPVGGVLAGLAGVRQDISIILKGAGSAKAWDGTLLAQLGSDLKAELALDQAAGEWRIAGPVSGNAIAKGTVGALTGGSVTISANGRFEDRVLKGLLEMRGSGRPLGVTVTGGLDLGRSSFDNVAIDVSPARDQAFGQNVRTQGMVARARIDGPFSAFGYEYLVSARRLATRTLTVNDIRAAGEGRYSRVGTTTIPLDLRVASIGERGTVVSDISRDLRIAGVVRMNNGRLLPSPLAVRSAKGAGTLTLADGGVGGFASGRLVGGLNAVGISGLGIVDLDLSIDARPRRAASFDVSGKAAAVLRRLDNGFLRSIGGGLPRLSSGLRLAPDGRLLFEGLRITAPQLSGSATGFRRPDGSFRFDGRGQHSSYGPFAIQLDGRIERPVVTVELARPMDAAGLADVSVRLTPDASGFAISTSGQSRIGAFSGGGAILFPAGGTALIRIDSLSVGDTSASGTLTPVNAGLSGRLVLSGGVAGSVQLSVPDGVQVVDLDVAANGARFSGLSIARGTVTGRMRLVPGATSTEGQMAAGGVQAGALQIGRAIGTIRLVNGNGNATIRLSRQRGRLFDLAMDAAIAPERLTIGINGSLARAPISLAAPAELTLEPTGWRLAPATLRYQGGTVTLSGLFGDAAMQLRATTARMPLSIADIINPDLGLGGTLNGTLSYDVPRNGAATGRAELRVRGLSRSGLAASSRPIDIGLNAALDPARAAARLVIADKGKVIGRAQTVLTPLASGNSLVERLGGATLRGQVRYAGDADTLWRLTNLELFTLSGPAQVSADLGGTVADPRIAGQVVVSGGSLQSPVTGMALTAVTARGTFDGGRLNMDSMSARTKGGGTVTGTARFDLSGTRGIGIDMTMQADKALLLDRDDIAATVSGPVSIRSDGNGGTIGGTLDVVSSRFALGRAEAIATIPELALIEVNRRGEELPAPVRTSPWRLDIAANARNRLMVSGLGMDSEWRANLRIGGTVTNPAITGRADLVRGSYDFAGKRFDLREGMLRFTGSVPVNPVLDIQAVADVSDIAAGISVTGTSAAPQITFTSTPALPQDELLSRLLFGTSITNLSAPEAIQLASAVAAFQGGGGGLDPINAVRRATGLSRLRILPADATTGAQTSVAAGRYIGRRIYVELVTDGQGYSATRVEYQITRWLSLLSSVSTIGRQSLNARISRDY